MSAAQRAPKPPRIDRSAGSEPERAPDGPVLSGETREGERYDGTDFTGADLEFSTFVGCVFDRCRLFDTALRGVHLVECVLRGLDVPVFSSSRSSWRGVRLTASRLGSAELYESSWRSVVITDAKINYLNARTATWTDVVFRNCVIDELDLGHASVDRMDLQDCEIGTLDVTGAKLADVDLRSAGLSHLKGLAGLAGAWVSEDQLTRLAPLLADHLKINIG